MWKRLSQMHNNILPFLGVTNTYPPSMVSPWMNNGCMTEYVRSHQDVNRLQLVCPGFYVSPEQSSHLPVDGDLRGAEVPAFFRGCTWRFERRTCFQN